MGFPVQRAQRHGFPIFRFGPNPRALTACALLLSVVLGLSSSASLSARAVAPASTETRGGVSEVIAAPSLEARVESLLRRMTLEEKIGQLVQYSAGQATGPGTGRTDYQDMIARGQVGSLLNVIDTSLINEYQRIAVERSRLHIDANSENEYSQIGIQKCDNFNGLFRESTAWLRKSRGFSPLSHRPRVQVC